MSSSQKSNFSDIKSVESSTSFRDPQPGYFLEREMLQEYQDIENSRMDSFTEYARRSLLGQEVKKEVKDAMENAREKIASKLEDFGKLLEKKEERNIVILNIKWKMVSQKARQYEKVLLNMVRHVSVQKMNREASEKYLAALKEIAEATSEIDIFDVNKTEKIVHDEEKLSTTTTEE